MKFFPMVNDKREVVLRVIHDPKNKYKDRSPTGAKEKRKRQIARSFIRKENGLED